MRALAPLLFLVVPLRAAAIVFSGNPGEATALVEVPDAEVIEAERALASVTWHRCGPGPPATLTVDQTLDLAAGQDLPTVQGDFCRAVLSWSAAGIVVADDGQVFELGLLDATSEVELSPWGGAAPFVQQSPAVLVIELL